jgi:hypothetical protein
MHHMWRGLKLTLAVALGLTQASTLWAQSSDGASLADRLRVFGSASQPDDQVRPAANTSRGAGAKDNRGGSMFSRMKLGNLLQGGIFDRDEPQTRQRHPSPYDPEEVHRQRVGSRTSPAVGRGSATANRGSGATSRSVASPQSEFGQSITTRQVPSSAASNSSRSYQLPNQTIQGGFSGSSVSSTARIARRSPNTNSRGDELAEALRGLQQAEASATDQDLATAADLPAAVADDTREDEVPAYLRGLTSQPSRAGTASVSSVPKSQPRSTGTLDLSKALQEADHRDEIAAQAAAAAQRAAQQEAAARQEAIALREAARQQAAANRASQQVVGTPQASGPSQQQDASLGAIPVQSRRRTDPSAVTESSAKTSSSRSAATRRPTPAVAANTTPEPLADDSTTSARDTADGAEAANPWSLAAEPEIADPEPTGPEILLTYQQPIIASRVLGPRQIIVGRESSYQVVLENVGKTRASDLLVTVEIPAWADVADVRASNGVVEPTVSQEPSDAVSRRLTWRLYDLAASSTQKLDLQLIPREGRDLQLGIHWTQAAAGSETVVEVQEPMLHMAIAGPSDVLYGEPQRYTLSLSNPGTGVADDVVIELLPPGGDPGSLVTHKVGSVAPGERKTLELELTAREAGDLVVQAAATALGDLRVETVKNVVCRRPELEIDWRGPEKKYAGTSATYYLRVRNPGTAVTSSVVVDLKLPPGAEFVTGSAGHALNQAGDAVTWKISGLRPQEEQFMQVQCLLTRPGTNEMQVSANTTTGDLKDSKTIVANVVALADLKLEVTDPKGPIPVGELATYTVTIRNRGTTEARGIDVIGLFSGGIEPTTVEGAQHSVHDGRVAFRTIERLPAGRDVVLQIHAKGKEAGTHVFRAEVVCQDLDIKLSAEETTRFFVDDFRWDDASTAYADQADEAVRQ